MTREPNLDLLLRQRTFSIDETREQLRQGKPVHKDAVISGAVDYESMFYGDAAPNASANATSVAEAKPAAPQKSSPANWAGIVAKAVPVDATPKASVAVSTASPKKAASDLPPPPPVSGVSTTSAPSSADTKGRNASTSENKADTATESDKKSDQSSQKNSEKRGKGESRKGKDGKVRCFK